MELSKSGTNPPLGRTLSHPETAPVSVSFARAGWSPPWSKTASVNPASKQSPDLFDRFATGIDFAGEGKGESTVRTDQDLLLKIGLLPDRNVDYIARLQMELVPDIPA